MKLSDFIKKNRKAIDGYIKRASGIERPSNYERRAWILNDESLYLWARANGVKLQEVQNVRISRNQKNERGGL